MNREESPVELKADEELKGREELAGEPVEQAQLGSCPGGYRSPGVFLAGSSNAPSNATPSVAPADTPLLDSLSAALLDSSIQF